MRYFLILLLIAGLGRTLQALQPPPDQATRTTYYVDADLGDDSNPGTTPESAFRSLKRAVAVLNRTGGDTLVLRGAFRAALNLSFINHRPNGQPVTKRVTLARDGYVAISHVVSYLLLFQSRRDDSKQAQVEAT